MRVARIVQHFQPKFGYADLYLMNTFKKFGHEVCVITSDVYSSGVTVLSPSSKRKTKYGKRYEYGLLVYRLPTQFELNEQPLNFFGLKDVLNDFNPHIIHSNDLFWSITLLAAHYKPNFRYKLFVDSITGTFNPTGYKITIFKTFKLLFKHYLRKNIDGFFAVCEGSKKWLSKNFSIPYNSINVVPLGADKDLFAPDAKVRRIMRKKLGFVEDDLVIIYAGKIIPEKDIDILIEGMALASQNCSRRIKALVIGNGPEEYIGYLRTLARRNDVKEKIVFLPTVDRSLLPKYYNVADIAVWPGSPSISIIEAMSTGLPIIIAKYPEPREDAYDTTHLYCYDNGLAFQRKCIAELAFCIRKLASDERLRKDMGKKSRRLVEDKLNWEAIASQYLKMYCE